ncbi:hypothetical protein [Pseudochryseolinea flava]|uniref:Uncharacterized protein n=1 Tax=Pseudochryseolinea flava TaxID=2059302 RepID=A0A364XZ42_9BACT|nr:hypothetical protein [Pseudochryseolinea flava]RAV99259.1 hypothetical protein DQQ10_20410 [Pseudochryseolinea flava]
MKTILYGVIFTFLLFACRRSNESTTAADSTGYDSSATNAGAQQLTMKQYDARLTALPIKLSSSGEGLEIFKVNFNKQNPVSCDSAFDRYLIFQSELINTLQQQLEARADYEVLASWSEEVKFSEATQAYIDSLAQNALRMTQEEGVTFLDAEPEMIKREFHPFMSPAGKDYITQWQIETEHPFAIDAGFTISVEQLIDRLVYWDSFLDKYSGTIFQKEVEAKKNAYLYFLLIGMDNTPAFDYGETERLSDEFRNAYVNFVGKYPPSKSRSVIEEYLKLLTSTDFKKTEAIDKFVDRYSNF